MLWEQINSAAVAAGAKSERTIIGYRSINFTLRWIFLETDSSAVSASGL